MPEQNTNYSDQICVNEIKLSGIVPGDTVLIVGNCRGIEGMLDRFIGKSYVVDSVSPTCIRFTDGMPIGAKGLRVTKMNNDITYSTRQRHSGLNVGDKVKIFRKMESNNELGFSHGWNQGMSEMIDSDIIYTVTGITNTAIYLDKHASAYSWPFFVLEKMPITDNIKLPKVMIGSDPEFNLFKYGSPVPANDYISDEHRRNEIGLDGHSFTGELRPKPGTAFEHFRNLKKIIQKLNKRTLKNSCGVDVIGNYEPLGFHVHLSFPYFSGSKSRLYNAVVQLMDELLGKKFYPLNGEARNDNNYGTLSSYRTQDHGMEYRTLPAICYQTPQIARIVFKVSQKIATYCLKNYRNHKAMQFIISNKNIFLKKFLTDKQYNYFNDFIEKYKNTAYRDREQGRMLSYWMKSRKLIDEVVNIFFASKDYTQRERQRIISLLKETPNNPNVYFFGLKQSKGNAIYVDWLYHNWNPLFVGNMFNLRNIKKIKIKSYDLTNIKLIIGLNVNTREQLNFYSGVEIELKRQLLSCCLTQYTQDSIIGTLTDYLSLIKSTQLEFAGKKCLVIPDDAHGQIRGDQLIIRNSKSKDIIVQTEYTHQPIIRHTNANLMFYDNKYIIGKYDVIEHINDLPGTHGFKDVLIRNNKTYESISIIMPVNTDIVTEKGESKCLIK